IEQGAETNDRSNQAEQVKPRRALAAPVEQEARPERDAKQADRYIDKEHPAPQIVIEQPAAQDEPKCRRRCDRDPEVAQRCPLLARWNRAEELRRAKRDRDAAAKSLQGPRRDQQPEIGRNPAEERAQDKQSQAAKIYALDTKTVGQEASHWRANTQRQDI